VGRTIPLTGMDSR